MSWEFEAGSVGTLSAMLGVSVIAIRMESRSVDSDAALEKLG